MTERPSGPRSAARPADAASVDEFLLLLARAIQQFHTYPPTSQICLAAIDACQRALLTLRECPEFGIGTCRYIDTGERAVLALVYDAPAGAMLALTNLGPTKRTVSIGRQKEVAGDPMEVFANRDYPAVTGDLSDLAIAGYGYRWIRLRRTIGARAGSAR